QIKTAGVGVDAEVNLRAVSKEEAERIRQHLNREGEAPEGGLEEVAKALRALQGRDLWLAGLTSGRFMALFSVAAVALSQVIDYIPQSYIDQALTRITGVPLLLGLGIVLALFFATWALSTVVFALQFANFTVRRFEDRLELDWGVIKRSHVTVRLHRLQAVVVQQGLLRQPFGLCTLLVEVAGGGAKEQEKVSILYPMLRMREVEGFLRDLLPEYTLPSAATRAPVRARRRYLFRSTVPMALFIAALLAASYHWNVPYGWAALLLLVPALLLGRSRHSNAKFSIDGDQLTIGFRSLGLYQVLIGREHVQSLSLLANPFQRLGRLRTLSISLLSSPAGKAYALKDLDASDAWAVREWYSRG
ncbi:MAG TPA: PH domain-containing protein, partial [Methanomassiliicoccales archaeon]|nr:PH domain-containing protein [Methanomassiliicoccales archaeon]